MLDFIVVGFGLSGLSITSHLEQRGRSFVVFEDESLTSSRVAGGIYNPVILKRFTLAWEADKQMNYSIPFYQKLESKFSTSFLKPFNIYRRFHSIEEQNNWFEAADNFRLAPFLNTQLLKDVNPYISGDLSFGKVLNTGTLDTKKLLDVYKEYLQEKSLIRNVHFDYSKVRLENDHISYDRIKAKKIIFCDGYGLTQNPFFNYLPLRGNKGEYIIIRSEALKLSNAVKSSVFILPLGDDLYKIGATYDHKDKSQEPTTIAKEKLKSQLEKIIKCEYKIIDQVAGIRPATADRRPLLGNHPEYKNMYVCNGFGSRGVLIAPLLSEKLLNFIEDNIPLPSEVDILRFQKKYYPA